MRIQRSLQTMAVWLLPALLMPDAQLMLVALLPVVPMHNDTVIGNKLISILHLRGLFDKLEKGVDTPIDNRFITLSGGEKQKITLMRALVHNPSIILLDEPTSALDKDSIDDLKKYLTSIKKNRIIIISTHDKNIVDLADVTINLDKGHIFEAEVL